MLSYITIVLSQLPSCFPTLPSCCQHYHREAPHYHHYPPRQPISSRNVLLARRMTFLLNNVSGKWQVGIIFCPLNIRWRGSHQTRCYLNHEVKGGEHWWIHSLLQIVTPPRLTPPHPVHNPGSRVDTRVELLLTSVKLHPTYFVVFFFSNTLQVLLLTVSRSVDKNKCLPSWKSISCVRVRALVCLYISVLVHVWILVCLYISVLVLVFRTENAFLCPVWWLVISVHMEL